MIKTLARWALAAVLLIAGVGHFARLEEFRAQVPPWMPAPDAVVIVSGVVEIALAVALIGFTRWRPHVGWMVAAFFVLVFPGNISQFITGTDGFGLDSDAARAIRLLFQPVLVIWALWCTNAWRDWRRRRAQTPSSAA